MTANVPEHWLIDRGVPRAITDVENKGMLIVSPNPITVHLANSENTGIRNPDATILRPILTDDTADQFVISYSPGSTGPERPKSFLMVVAATTDAAVDVEVFHYVGGDWQLDHEFELDVNEVFTEDDWQTDGGQGVDYTASMVRASGPVAVYAGHGCAKLPASVGITYCSIS